MLGVLLIPPAYGSLPVSKREASVQDIAHPYGSHVDDLEKGTHSAPIFANGLHVFRLINLIPEICATGGRQKVDFCRARAAK